MKYLSMILIFLWFSSCTTDENPNSGGIPDKLPALNVDAVVQFMPLDIYRNASEIIFKNENDQFKIMIPSVEELDQSVRFDNQIPYDTKQVNLTLKESLNDNYTINMQANASYSTISTPIQFLFGSIFSAVNAGITPTIRINQKMEPELNTQFSESLELLGNTYDNVYYNLIFSETNTSYEQFFYNSTQGFVAFKDENNELWVLDQIK